MDNEIQEAIKAVDKEYGEGSIAVFSEQKKVNKDNVLSTGLLSVDTILGNGGIVKGSVVEISGPESSGKTSLALFVIAEAQKNGMTTAFIDMEHALDIDLAIKYGVDIDKLLFKQPDCGEEALGITEVLIQTGKVQVVVVDSVDALVPRCVLEGEMEDSNMGKQAKLMSQALRILNPLIEKNNVIVIFINQIRMKIGIVYGSPETTSGGQALKYYSAYRLDVRRKNPIKDGDRIIGAETKITVKKNKKAPPYRECIIDLIYGKGVDKFHDCVNIAVALGIIEKKGAWYFFEGNQLGQGSVKCIEALIASPETFNKIKTNTLELLNK